MLKDHCGRGRRNIVRARGIYNYKECICWIQQGNYTYKLTMVAIANIGRIQSQAGENLSTEMGKRHKIPCGYCHSLLTKESQYSLRVYPSVDLACSLRRPHSLMNIGNTNCA